MLIRKCSGIDMALLAVQNGVGRVLHGYVGKVLTNLRRIVTTKVATHKKSGVFEP